MTQDASWVRGAVMRVMLVVLLAALSLALCDVCAYAASTGSISGSVTDANGLPIDTQDICVAAQSSSNSVTPPVTATTDASGNYTIADVPTGDYAVSFSDCASSSRNDEAQTYGEGSEPGGEPVLVRADLATTGVSVQLTAAASISGHVYSGPGTASPLAGACVYASDAASRDDGATGEAITAADGSYTVRHIESGLAYTVEFDPSCAGKSSANDAPSYYGGATSNLATPVTPTLATPATGIDGHLSAGASISGTVTDANGSPITSQDVCISATIDLGATAGAARTDAGGSYTIDGLAAGTYDLQAADCPGSARNDADSHVGTVTLAAGAAQTGVNLELAAGTSISGHVYAGSGTSTPLGPVCVTVDSTTQLYYEGSTTTGTDGSYVMRNLNPDVPYAVMFDPSCLGQSTSPYTVEYYNGASTPQTETPVTPSVAAPATGIDGHLATGASISGQITDASGAPITSEDVCVYAYESTGGFGYGSTTTDAAGHYTVEGLPPGAYTVFVRDCDGGARNDGSDGYPSTVTLATGQAATGIDVQLAAATTISGHVYGGAGTGSPLRFVCVEASPAGSATGSYAEAVHGRDRRLHADGRHARRCLHRDVRPVVPIRRHGLRLAVLRRRRRRRIRDGRDRHPGHSGGGDRRAPAGGGVDQRDGHRRERVADHQPGRLRHGRAEGELRRAGCL